jgi:hypothetical protein
MVIDIKKNSILVMCMQTKNEIANNDEKRNSIELFVLVERTIAFFFFDNAFIDLMQSPFNN